MARIAALLVILCPIIVGAQPYNIDRIYNYSDLDNQPEFKGGDKQLEHLFNTYFTRKLDSLPNESINLSFLAFIDRNGSLVDVDLYRSIKTKGDRLTGIVEDELIKIWERIKQEGFKFDSGEVGGAAVLYERNIKVCFNSCLESAKGYIISIGEPNYSLPELIGDYRKFDLQLKKNIFTKVDTFSQDNHLYISTYVTKDSLLSTEVELIKKTKYNSEITDTSDIQKFKDAVIKSIQVSNTMYKWTPYLINNCRTERRITFVINLDETEFYPTHDVEVLPEPETGAKQLTYMFLSHIGKKEIKKEVIKSDVRSDIKIEITVNTMCKASFYKVLKNEYYSYWDEKSHFEYLIHDFFEANEIWWYPGITGTEVKVAKYQWVITYDEMLTFVKGRWQE